MQWIADRIHDFTEADCQKSRGWCIEWHFWRDDWVVVFRVFPNHDLFTLLFRNHFLCFLLPFFILFLKVQSKIGVRIIHGRALYTGKCGNKSSFWEGNSLSLIAWWALTLDFLAAGSPLILFTSQLNVHHTLPLPLPSYPRLTPPKIIDILLYEKMVWTQK